MSVRHGFAVRTTCFFLLILESASVKSYKAISSLLGFFERENHYLSLSYNHLYVKSALLQKFAC